MPSMLLALAVFTSGTPNDDDPLPHVKVEARTADGAVLRGKRYVADGVPVVLIHGLAANLFQFDINEEKSPSLSVFLRRRGFDVWLFNLRGSGRDELESLLPPGSDGWCADHHVLFDIPAIHRHVQKATKTRPFFVGHSLGGMVIAAYLAGATPRDPKNLDAGVTMDREAARERNRGVRGVVILSSPLQLDWENPPKLLTRLAKIARSPVGRLLPSRLKISKVNGLNSSDAPDFVRKASARIENFLNHELLKSEWAEFAFGSKTREHALVLIKKFRGQVLSDTSRELLRQLAYGVKREGWVSHLGPEDRWIDYSRYYQNIRTPAIVLVGDEDRVADATHQSKIVAARLGSPDKKFVKVRGYGHTGITLGGDAHVDVFKTIDEWLEQRRFD